MFLGLFALLIFAPGAQSQAKFPEEFCSSKPPAIHIGDHYEIIVNRTDYDYGRGIEVTVRPKANSTVEFQQISDMFLYVPAQSGALGKNNSRFLGKWYASYPSTAAYCQYWWLASGIKLTEPEYPVRNITIAWVAPKPAYKRSYGRVYFDPNDKERTRPHIYFAVYLTPDPPVRYLAPGARNMRRWYFAVSPKIENNEIRMKRLKETREKKQRQMWLDMIESMN